MSLSATLTTVEQYHTTKTRTLISNMLKIEKPILQMAWELGFSVKATRYIIRRWGLEKNLTRPVLIGVK